MDVAVSTVTEFAPAKINLALHVTGRRADGYHLLESLVVFTRFGDRIAVEPAPEDVFSVGGPFAADVPMDDGNLVVRARDSLRRYMEGGGSTAPLSVLPDISPLVGEMSGRTEAGGKKREVSKFGPVSIHLQKNLPVASGMGGGSSDAAAILRALARLWGVEMSEQKFARIGLDLGADVPMSLTARPLVARGIGDELSLVPDFPAHGLVLVNPGRAVSTAEVFAALARRDNQPLPPLPKLFDFHSLRNWLEITRNDLEGAARTVEPAVGHALAALNRAGAGFARMSGSGATCFGLFETGNVAKRAALELRKRHPDWFVAATRSIATGADTNG